MSENIGKRIRELRLKKGITQEELGKELGMTAQGISKWERGATPDTLLLPKIAEVLGVSIDYLFGKETDPGLDVAIVRELSSMEESEAFKRAFQLCWNIEMGVTGKNAMKNNFTSEIVEALEEDETGSDYFSRIVYDGGLVSARLNKNARYFFFMPEPEGSISEYLGSTGEMTEIFSVLSDSRILEILKYLYSRKNIPVSIDLISKHTNLNKNETIDCMTKLTDKKFVNCSEIETNQGIIKAYTYDRELSVLPLLIYAKELQSEKYFGFVMLTKRDKPLIN